jgi:hypothetical protein
VNSSTIYAAYYIDNLFAARAEPGALPGHITGDDIYDVTHLRVRKQY